MKLAGRLVCAAALALCCLPTAAHVDLMDHTPLMLAVEAGDLPQVEHLLAKGAAIDEANKIGTTALMEAARAGHHEVAAALLAHGADVHATDKAGHTALHYAAMSGHAGIVRALVGAGADVNARDNRGNTPLRVAEGLKKYEAADALRALGATDTAAKPR